jgi:HK97 family phage major capsid protein
MTKLEKLLARQDVLLENMDALAGKEDITDEDDAKFNEMDAEYVKNEKEIKKLEALAARKQEAEAREAEEKKPVNTPRVTVKEPQNDKPFKNLGEQMLAVVRAGRPGGEIDPRLLQVQAGASGSSGANEGVPSEGGFLVQTDFTNEILKDVYETGILAPRCRKIAISANANGLKINGIDETSRVDGSRWGGVRGYWAEEAGTVTATKPKFRQIELRLNKLMGIYYSTDELLQDAAAMNSILTQAFSSEIRFKLDDAIVRGTGSGQPLGILNAGCLVTQNKESGQVADTVVFENILKMWSRLIASSRANSVWFINQEIEPQLYSMVLSAGTSAVPVYMPAGGISGQQYGTLFGRPVVPIEHCSAPGDVGDIILADMSQYLLADKGGMQMASSIHVQFLYDETAFRIVYRVDGQPIRSSAITPFKGNNDLSSFVTLQAR